MNRRDLNEQHTALQKWIADHNILQKDNRSTANNSIINFCLIWMASNPVSLPRNEYETSGTDPVCKKAKWSKSKVSIKSLRDMLNKSNFIIWRKIRCQEVGPSDNTKRVNYSTDINNGQ